MPRHRMGAANHVCNKGLVFRIYREVLQLNNKKDNSILWMGRDSEQTFLQRRYNVNEHTKRFLTSFATGVMQIKTTAEYHFTPTRTTITERQ